MAQERVGFRPSFFESNPSAKSVKSVVKTIFENGTAIEFARAATEWTQLETAVKNLRKMQ